MKLVSSISFSSLVLSSILSGGCAMTPTDIGEAGDTTAAANPEGEFSDLAPTDGQTPGSTDAAPVTHRVGRRHRSNRAPAVQQAPFQVDNFWMNAFYFVRSDSETWESLSQTLYGRPDRAQLLSKWNSEAPLGVGTVVYYNSPMRPEDGQTMKVFSEDFGYKLETVTVQAGDWLSKIGQAQYGDVRTWMEIAAINPDIVNPDRIEIGQVLRLQPAQIDTASVIARLAQTNQNSQNAQVTPPADDNSAPEKAAVTGAGTEGPPDSTAPPSGGISALGRNVVGVIMNNVNGNPLMLVGVVMILGAGVLLIRKRRAGGGFKAPASADIAKIPRIAK
jgi:LPXTG-motif cell wall-anchored protein